ncbi:hypothetical protein Cob_v013070 [Colletotrichum orbiculare MAFF 240422]|uniref:Uncharacterized protein n=1 Tax=Colletotrichum orbiculare (strain 104-T / ATCC 96160 / CBS 514.97 / LARS 414 / MAFF 240422) TaxID=1213857 RepID=A0A484F701_COLOR|nr:hypothetical protein Cob_v013070 [Colletotrichum orbiculare MAFF 240422]
MDELLDVELLSDQEPIDYPSSGAFSSTSPEGKGESRESSFSASGSSSSIEWDATQQSNRDRHGDFLHSPLIPLKRASTSAMSPSLALHLAPFPPDFESITNSPGAPATRQSPSRQTVQPSPQSRQGVELVLGGKDPLHSEEVNLAMLGLAKLQNVP